MGGLKVFGRRWGISSDDFVFPALSEAIIRFIWSITVLCIFAGQNRSACSAAANINLYVTVMLTVNAFSVVLCFSIGFVSSRGTIKSNYPRRHISKLIYARLPLLFFEFLWNIVGTSWAFAIPAQQTSCERGLVIAAQVTAVLCWILYVSFFVQLWLVFDPLGGVIHADRVKLNDQVKQVWRRRLKLFFCCSGRDDTARSAFEAVAEVLSDFFSDYDLVLSDIWAGLLLLANREFSVLELKKAPVLNAIPPPEWMNVKSACRFMQFALGVYGWPYYICDNFGCKSACDLLRRLRFCGDCRCDNVIVINDNSCLCNTAALKLQTGISDTDLFYISFKNKVFETPFIVCVDVTTSSIVVAIRGSMSLRDIVTDLCFHEESFDLPYAPAASAKVHRGILNSARYVHSVLEAEKVLEDLFILHPHFELVLTGHSLGAGVAAVLSFMLKSKYPNVRCYAFSPPGCVVSEDCLALTEDFIFSIVVGYDLVPRLSRETVNKLKANIIHAIDDCNRAKYEILVRGCFRMICGYLKETYQRQNTGESHQQQIEDDSGEFEDSYRSASHSIVVDHDIDPLLSRARTSTSYYSFSSPEADAAQHYTLRIPGRILHLAETGRSGSGIYMANWVSQNQFQQLVLSSSMISDHMPYNVAAILNKVARQTDVVSI